MSQKHNNLKNIKMDRFASWVIMKRLIARLVNLGFLKNKEIKK